jgi:Rrf2 family nitric oxide-sensitive transcriptional repressor
MHLTAQADYALRSLMFLAVRDSRRATIPEMARHYGISRGHLMVLIRRLGALGFVENTRGRGGGVRLARPASEIRVGEVVRAMEPHFRLVECFDADSNQCLISRPCRLRAVLDEALAAWLAVLDNYTLADLVQDNPGLSRLLGVAPAGRRGRGKAGNG